MSFLVVSDAGVYSCRQQRCEYSPGVLPSAAVLEAKRSRVNAVLLAGLTSIDPLDLAFKLQTEVRRRLLIGVVGSMEEVPISDKILSSIPDDIKSDARPRRLKVDVAGREILSDNARMTCSPIEIRLLMLFLRYPEIVFSRSELLRRISLMGSTANPRIIDVLVRRLRAKIEIHPERPAHLRTIQRLGYVFRRNSDVFVDRMTRSELTSWPFQT